jgi:hypothetical protein
MRFLNIWKSLEEQIKITKTEFDNIPGLDETIKGILNLKESEIYEKVYEATKIEPKNVEEQESVDELLKIPQVKLASKILKKPIYYIPPLTDVIIASHFIGTISMLDFIRYAYKQKKLSKQDINKNHTLLEQIIPSLNHFNTTNSYEVPDEGYYRKLKQIKWNKQGKKLFGKLHDIKFTVQSDRWKSDFTTFGTGEMFMLGFLAACNAVNHQRNTMLPEDVIRAYKTYFKLLNTDINKLEL